MCIKGPKPQLPKERIAFPSASNRARPTLGTRLTLGKEKAAPQPTGGAKCAAFPKPQYFGHDISSLPDAVEPC